MLDNPRPSTEITRRCIQFASLLAASAVAAFFCLSVIVAYAQDNPQLVIDEDCQAFDISADNAVVCAVPHLKSVKRLVIERDDILVATGPGKAKRIVEADKFMPFPPPFRIRRLFACVVAKRPAHRSQHDASGGSTRFHGQRC